MYGVDGTRRLPELELGWLAGCEESAPVRTGNGAADQLHRLLPVRRHLLGDRADQFRVLDPRPGQQVHRRVRRCLCWRRYPPH
jgi:hypothetical protein